MQSEYHKADKLAPLYDETGTRRIDSIAMGYIIQAEVMDEVNGISSEGKTYQQLYDQGRAQAVKDRAKVLYDSTMYVIDGKRRAQGLPAMP